MIGADKDLKVWMDALEKGDLILWRGAGPSYPEAYHMLAILWELQAKRIEVKILIREIERMQDKEAVNLQKEADHV